MFTINSHLYKIFIIICLILLIFSGCLSRPQPQTGDFNGKVIDSLTKEPVPGVVITIGGQKTTTDLNGKFSIAVLPSGDYQLTMGRDWYYPLTQTEHHIGKQDSLEFSLIPLPLEGKILYSGDGTGHSDIYELDLKNNRCVTKLSTTAWTETNPVKLPDNRIIFQSNRNGRNDDLFIADFDNVNSATPISFCSTDCDDENPSVTINSSEIKLVFKSGEKDSKGSTNGFIRLCNLTKNQSIIITEDNKQITGYNPVINPDGTKIVLVSGDYEKLLLFDVSGMSVTKSKEFDVYSAKTLKINNPCWSPKGDYIAFDAYQNSKGSRSIYRISSDAESASELRQITFAQGSQLHEHPCWSSDGSMIFFSGNIIYSSRFDIYGIKVSDGMQGKMSWVMVSSGSGSKDYPSWSE
jgi:Tol biopolymer transport system component